MKMRCSTESKCLRPLADTFFSAGHDWSWSKFSFFWVGFNSNVFFCFFNLQEETKEDYAPRKSNNRVIEIGIDRKRMCALNVSLWHPDYVVEEKKKKRGWGERADLLLYNKRMLNDGRKSGWLLWYYCLIFFWIRFFHDALRGKYRFIFRTWLYSFKWLPPNWLVYLAIVCCCFDWFPNVGYISQQLVGGLGMFNASFPSAKRASAV